MQRVVVTGGAGFLGSHLCARLFGMGAEVICIDNFVTGHADNVEELLGRPGFTLMHYDVTNHVHVPGPVDAVLHFASAASPPDYMRHPIATLDVGSAGTRNLLELARAKDARFFMASTSEVYGDPLVSPQPETYWGNVNSVGPRSVYDEAKRFSEAMTMAYHDHLGVDVRIVRIFNCYGPRLRVDGRVVSNFIFQALTGRPLTIYGDGSQSRSFCYVDDLIDGIVALLLSDYVGPVNVGNPNEFTVRELADLVLELTGTGSELVVEPLPTDDPKQRRPDIGLAGRLFGFEPKVQLREGLARTIEWYRAELDAKGRIGGSGDPPAS